jgi:DNA-binding XRE family transcriptional regulator
MVKAGYTQKELAKSLGISEQTLTRKLKKRVFGTDEAAKIVELLNIDDPKAVFFGERVTY